MRYVIAAASPSLLLAWGFRAAPARPRNPKSDNFLAGAGQNKLLPLAAAFRGGRVSSLASFVTNGCCVICVRYVFKF